MRLVFPGVKRASSSSSPILAVTGRLRARRSFGVVLGVGLAALALGACGGDDDPAADSTTTTTSIAIAPPDETPADSTTSTTTSTTAAAVPDEPEYVTEGAIVVVANSSGIDGAAGRMSERLAAVGFEMGPATNGTEGQLELTKIYYDPANENALPVAESVRVALGGGDIELFEVGVPAPVDGGDPGDATVIVSMGNDTSDKSLEELQGRAPTPSTGEETGEETTGEETTGEETTGEETTGEATG